MQSSLHLLCFVLTIGTVTIQGQRGIVQPPPLAFLKGNGCTPAQQTILRDVYTRAHGALGRMSAQITLFMAQSYTPRSNGLNTAFGSWTPNYLQNIENCVTSMTHLTVNVASCAAKLGTLGSTGGAYDPAQKRFSFGLSFFGQVRDGNNNLRPTQVGTLIHEMSHAACLTGDTVKGQSGYYDANQPALYNRLTSMYPQFMIDNADSYRVYAQLV